MIDTEKLEFVRMETSPIETVRLYIRREPSGFRQGFVQSVARKISSVGVPNADPVDHYVRILESGTLSRLVDATTEDNGTLISMNLHVLISTYVMFASSEELASTIYDKIKANSGNEELSKSLTTIVQYWTKFCPHDFDANCRRSLVQSCHSLDSFRSGDASAGAVVCDEQDSGVSETNDATSDDHSDLGVYITGDGDRSLDSMSIREDPEDDVKLLDFPPDVIAQHLTSLDLAYFCQLHPHDLVRHVTTKQKSPHVQSCIQLFNKVCNLVRFSLLTGHDTCEERAEIIKHWVRVAQSLRAMKNFSSLKAVTITLFTTEISRLTKAWSHVPKSTKESLNELHELFAVGDNESSTRTLLSREGTAKKATEITSPQQRSQKKAKKSSTFSKWHFVSEDTVAPPPDIQGTIPFLGTFLTDLTMIHSAFSTRFPHTNLINFDKCRRIFDVLSQIQLYQKAASLYTFSELGETFEPWFRSVPLLSDSDCWELSCFIEPLDDASASSTPASSSGTAVRKHKRHKGLNSVRRIMSAASASDFRSIFFRSTPRLNTSLPASQAISRKDHSSRSLNVPTSNDLLSPHRDTLTATLSMGAMSQPPPSPTALSPHDTPASIRRSLSLSDDSTVVRIEVDPSCLFEAFGSPSVGRTKAIRIRPTFRTRDVVELCVRKFDLTNPVFDGEPPDPRAYSLAQRLPDGTEVSIAEGSNLSYALVPTPDGLPLIILRRDLIPMASSADPPPHPGTSFNESRLI